MTDIVTFQPLSAADLDEASALVASVSWPHRPVDIAFHMRLGQGRMAFSDAYGRTLGFGLWWSYGDQLARLGLIVIAPEAQGRGIGRRLVEHLLNDLSPRPVMLLATEAGKPLYDKLGFVPVDASSQYQGEYTGSPVPDPRLRPASPADAPAIAALDAKAFGVDRNEVLSALMADGEAAVLRQDGEVVGYAMSRRFGRGMVVGPIVADTEEDAVVLFDALARPGFLRVDCPSTATVLIGHLVARGLVRVDESPVMVRGARPVPQGPVRMFGLASHALG